MRIFKIELAVLLILLVISCKNVSNSDSKVSDSVAEVEAIVEKGDAEPSVDLTKYGIANNPNNVLGGLKVGDKAPDFQMMDQDGNEYSLETSLKDGPVLLVFLRAEWCSFCVRHLQAFQDNVEEIHNTGQAHVIAVSPQERSYMKDFHKEHQFSFPILNDEDHSVMKDYKVLFHVTEKYNSYIEEAKGKRIEVFNGDKEPVMPVPATYLIGQDKVIKYVHYDPNYKKRSDLANLIAQL